MKTYQRLARDTADTIEKYGWTRGKSGNREIGFCLIGSAMHQKGYNTRTYEKFWNVLSDTLEPWTTLSFNDEHAKSKEDIINLLRSIQKGEHYEKPL